MLYHSLHEKLLTLPDETKVFPAHGAGSACGKNLSTETVSTIGEQRRTNYALAPMTEDEFVAVVTQGQPVAPLYFPFAAVLNRKERELLHDEEVVPALSIDEVLARQHDGAVVIDARDDAAFAAGHLRGSINVGLGGRFAEYAGEVMKPETPIVLVTPPGHETEAKIRLARIGFDNVVGALDDPTAAFVARPELVEPAVPAVGGGPAGPHGRRARPGAARRAQPGRGGPRHPARRRRDQPPGPAQPAGRARPGRAHRRATAPAATARRSPPACCGRTASPTCPTSWAATPPGWPPVPTADAGTGPRPEPVVRSLFASPLGFLIGLSLGALGGGGSILAVPALVYAAGQTPKHATTTSLVLVAVTSVIGIVPHWRAGRVRFASGTVFGLAGVGGSLLGSHWNKAVDPDTLLLAFAGVMLVAAAAMWRRTRTMAVPAGIGTGVALNSVGAAASALDPLDLPAAPAR